VRVLVVGHQRTATTWIARVLSATPGSGYLHEPDDSGKYAFAVRAMAGCGNLPVLAADDPGSRGMVQLWDAAFGRHLPRYVRGQGRLSQQLMAGASDEELDQMLSSDRRLSMRLRLAAALAVPRHLKPGFDHHIVKSVQAALTLAWITARWDPVVVACFRHPLDVVASSIEAGVGAECGIAITRLLSPEALAIGTDRYGVPLPDGDERVPHMAWHVGLAMSALADACHANPAYHVVDHEQVCAHPVKGLRALVDAVGLDWTPDTERFVIDSNQPGTVWETNRIASEQPGRWRTRLTPADARAATEVLGQFPIAARYPSELAI
jgi:hypothetical protein